MADEMIRMLSGVRIVLRKGGCNTFWILEHELAAMFIR